MNEKLKETINEAIPTEEELKRLNSMIMNEDKIVKELREDDWSFKEPYLFTNGFIDCSLALCFCGCLVLVGMAFRGLIS